MTPCRFNPNLTPYPFHHYEIVVFLNTQQHKFRMLKAFKYSGNLKSQLVWISNGQKVVGLQMVWLSNGI